MTTYISWIEWQILIPTEIKKHHQCSTTCHKCCRAKRSPHNTSTGKWILSIVGWGWNWEFQIVHTDLWLPIWLKHDYGCSVWELMIGNRCQGGHFPAVCVFSIIRFVGGETGQLCECTILLVTVPLVMPKTQCGWRRSLDAKGTQKDIYPFSTRWIGPASLQQWISEAQ